MNLKTSFFNKSILMSDFKRFWWVSVLNTLGIFVFFTFIFIIDATSGGEWLRNQEILNYLDSRIYRWSGVYILNGIFPVGLSVLLFSYLNSVKSVACLHGMPIKRSTFFASHCKSGLVMLTLPMIINVIILLLFRFNADVAASFKVGHLFIFAGLYLVYTVLVFGFVTCVNMISGNSIAALIFSYVFAFLPFIAEVFIRYICDLKLYGYVNDFSEPFVKFLYYSPEELYNNPVNIVKYLIYSIIFYGGAFGIYKIRKLENSTEIIAFSKLRPVFVYGVAICAGCVGYAYFNAIWRTENLLLLIPFGVIGVIAAEMIVKKSLRVKKVYKPIILYCLFVCVVQFAFQADIFGFEKRIPDIDKVESIEIDGIGERYRDYWSDTSGWVFPIEENTDFVLEQDKKNITALHKELVKNIYDEVGSFGNVRFITLKYKMVNGSTLKREYYINFEKHKDLLTPIIESENGKKMFFPILREGKIDISSVYLGKQEKPNKLIYNKDEINKIVEALKKDLSALDYWQIINYNTTLTSTGIKVNGRATCQDEDRNELTNESFDMGDFYSIYDSFENVKVVLMELGIYDSVFGVK